MTHIRAVSRKPVKATTTLTALATFFVALVDIVTNIIFQKNGGAL